jgi:hypothetical protein
MPSDCWMMARSSSVRRTRRDKLSRVVPLLFMGSKAVIGNRARHFSATDRKA